MKVKVWLFYQLKFPSFICLFRLPFLIWFLLSRFLFPRAPAPAASSALRYIHFNFSATSFVSYRLRNFHVSFTWSSRIACIFVLFAARAVRCRFCLSCSGSKKGSANITSFVSFLFKDSCFAWEGMVLWNNFSCVVCWNVVDFYESRFRDFWRWDGYFVLLRVYASIFDARARFKVVCCRDHCWIYNLQCVWRAPTKLKCDCLSIKRTLSWTDWTETRIILKELWEVELYDPLGPVCVFTVVWFISV